MTPVDRVPCSRSIAKSISSLDSYTVQLVEDKHPKSIQDLYLVPKSNRDNSSLPSQ
ncbi:hypothetical protein PM082_023424 [Marasmius tenuissimus]|nr:hypothetical protein PM082_016589 [Marasmius tenuissimus]KAJ8094215.1 hypothetical protein PM082_023424 [Marasmius tenuissimus]